MGKYKIRVKRIFLQFCIIVIAFFCCCQKKQQEKITEKAEVKTTGNEKRFLPTMIEINIPELHLEVSETLITIKNFKYFLRDCKESDSSNLENEIRRLIDDGSFVIQDDFPLWGITWLDAVEYCNWLSLKQGFTPYYFVHKEDKTIVEINHSADGYRLPYVRELMIISGLKDGLSKDQYEKDNIFGIKYDYNHYNVIPVFNGKKNKYGIYDVLGNLPQYCNDYFNEEYDYFDYSLSIYGPDNYTPDADQEYFNEKLTAVRCYFGGYFYSNYEDIERKVIRDCNVISTGLIGIRLVRNLN